MSDSRPPQRGAICVEETSLKDLPEAGNADYVRARDLPRLVPLWPSEIATSTSAQNMRLLAKLRRALRRERQLGLSGHWTYDLARHAQLLRAYRAETAAHLRSVAQPTAAHRRK